MLAGCVRFPLVADLPEFNKLLLPVANTNIVPRLAEAVDVQTSQMILVGNDGKGREFWGEAEDVMCQQWLDVTDQWLASYRRLDAVMV